MALPTLQPDEVSKRVRFAHANDLHPVSMSFWTLSGDDPYQPTWTWLNVANFTPDKIYQVQTIDFQVSEGAGSVAYYALGFTKLAAAYQTPNQGSVVFLKLFINGNQGTMNFTPSGLYLQRGKTLSLMAFHTVPGQHIVGSVTLYLLETFES
jgi:hypothetical protein